MAEMDSLVDFSGAAAHVESSADDDASTTAELISFLYNVNEAKEALKALPAPSLNALFGLEPTHDEEKVMEGIWEEDPVEFMTQALSAVLDEQPDVEKVKGNGGESLTAVSWLVDQFLPLSISGGSEKPSSPSSPCVPNRKVNRLGYAQRKYRREHPSTVAAGQGREKKEVCHKLSIEYANHIMAHVPGPKPESLDRFIASQSNFRLKNASSNRKTHKDQTKLSDIDLDKRLIAGGKVNEQVKNRAMQQLAFLDSCDAGPSGFLRACVKDATTASATYQGLTMMEHWMIKKSGSDIKLRADGHIDARSAAIRSGDLKLTESGAIDKRSKLYQQTLSGIAPRRRAKSSAETTTKVKVEGYTKSDGTEVSGYTRTSPSKPVPAATTTVKVDGYTRGDGTKVSGYTRTSPSKPAKAVSSRSSPAKKTSSSSSSYSGGSYSGSSSSSSVNVSGYTRSNGTYVSGYSRSSPGKR